MSKYYLVYSSKISLQPNTAHEIHDVMCANAAANLDCPTVLVYPNDKQISGNPLAWVNPFQTQKPEPEFVDFYNVQDKLKIVPLPIPEPLKRMKVKGMNVSTLVCKYYFPFFLRSVTKAVHTRDWNFVKTAVKNGIPTIYERHYFQETLFEPEIVHNPFFKIAITQSEIIRQSLIKAGMPPEKVIWMHNGFEQSFLIRQPQEAQAWRRELLQDERKYLVVYSGALYRFKGIDLLIDAAKELPQIQFALTGGTAEQVQAYRQLAKEKQAENVTFLGWIIPRDRLVSLFQAADVLAHPHLSGEAANFTNPVKFFQYIASGTPIAVTEIPPLMEFKSSPIIAAWCQPDNPTEFAQCIQHVLNTYPRKVAGYSESIEFARQFSWEERATKILSYVKDDQHLGMLTG